MAHPNEVLVRKIDAAFGRGDMDAVRQYWAEDIRWHYPGRGPLAGDYEGVDQVLGLFGQLFELTGGTARVELHDVLANDEHAVMLSTNSSERAGKHWEDNIVLVMRIRGGKVTEVWSYLTDQYAADEFLS